MSQLSMVVMHGNKIQANKESNIEEMYVQYNKTMARLINDLNALNAKVQQGKQPIPREIALKDEHEQTVKELQDKLQAK